MTAFPSVTTPFLSREVQFGHGGTELAGILLLPLSSGPHPAVVMLHGAGPGDRDYGGYFPPIREWFVRAGIAVLCYDKPGCGESGGDWIQQSFEDRAEETLAAVGFLRRLDEIDSGRVGVWGLSQGGWIGPLAASMSPDVAFVLVVSGPGVGVFEQNLYDIENAMRARGLPEEEVVQLVDGFRQYMEAARRGQQFWEVEPMVRDARIQPILDHFGTSREQLATTWGFLQRTVDYEPEPVLERVRCPVLAIFGEVDPVVPVARSVEVFERALDKAGNRDVTIRVFPGADHVIHIPKRNAAAPSYLETMTEWMLRH